MQALKNNDANRFFHLVEQAADDFLSINNLKEIPRIGVVGEIYVKYNDFGHKHVVNWLVEQGIEAVLPPLTQFFISTFASQEARIKGNVKERTIPKFAMNLVEKLAYNAIRKMESKISHYPFYFPISNVHEGIKDASLIISSNAQFGEGWRIPAEFSEFAHNGINNVISLQPFGCIANHIISKGIEKRTKELFPNMNLLFLDFDSGMSEANIYNRLHFMIRNAQVEVSSVNKHELVDAI